MDLRACSVLTLTGGYCMGHRGKRKRRRPFEKRNDVDSHHGEVNEQIIRHFRRIRRKKKGSSPPLIRYRIRDNSFWFFLSAPLLISILAKNQLQPSCGCDAKTLRSDNYIPRHERRNSRNLELITATPLPTVHSSVPCDPLFGNSEKEITNESYDGTLPTTSPVLPINMPTTQPTATPSAIPTSNPSMASPSCAPTLTSTLFPTGQATNRLTDIPSSTPSDRPSMHPSNPQTIEPTVLPTDVQSAQLTVRSTVLPTTQPTVRSTFVPSAQPTVRSTVVPSAQPTVRPTVVPSVQPVVRPTVMPSVPPTERPTGAPTIQPTGRPIDIPTVPPTGYPTMEPTGTSDQLPGQQQQPTLYSISLPTFLLNLTVPFDGGEGGNANRLRRRILNNDTVATDQQLPVVIERELEGLLEPFVHLGLQNWFRDWEWDGEGPTLLYDGVNLTVKSIPVAVGEGGSGGGDRRGLVVDVGSVAEHIFFGSKDIVKHSNETLESKGGRVLQTNGDDPNNNTETMTLSFLVNGSAVFRTPPPSSSWTLSQVDDAHLDALSSEIDAAIAFLLGDLSLDVLLSYLRENSTSNLLQSTTDVSGGFVGQSVGGRESSSDADASTASKGDGGSDRPSTASIVIGFLLVAAASISLFGYGFIFARKWRRKRLKKRRQRDGARRDSNNSVTGSAAASVPKAPFDAAPLPDAAPAASSSFIPNDEEMPPPPGVIELTRKGSGEAGARKILPHFRVFGGGVSPKRSYDEEDSSSSYEEETSESSEAEDDAFARELAIAATIDRHSWEELENKRRGVAATKRNVSAIPPPSHDSHHVQYANDSGGGFFRVETKQGESIEIFDANPGGVFSHSMFDDTENSSAFSSSQILEGGNTSVQQGTPHHLSLANKSVNASSGSGDHPGVLVLTSVSSDASGDYQGSWGSSAEKPRSTTEKNDFMLVDETSWGNDGQSSGDFGSYGALSASRGSSEPSGDGVNRKTTSGRAVAQRQAAGIADVKHQQRGDLSSTSPPGTISGQAGTTVASSDQQTSWQGGQGATFLVSQENPSSSITVTDFSSSATRKTQTTKTDTGPSSATTTVGTSAAVRMSPTSNNIGRSSRSSTVPTSESLQMSQSTETVPTNWTDGTVILSPPLTDDEDSSSKDEESLLASDYVREVRRLSKFVKRYERSRKRNDKKEEQTKQESISSGDSSVPSVGYDVLSDTVNNPSILLVGRQALGPLATDSDTEETSNSAKRAEGIQSTEEIGSSRGEGGLRAAHAMNRTQPVRQSDAGFDRASGTANETVAFGRQRAADTANRESRILRQGLNEGSFEHKTAMNEVSRSRFFQVSGDENGSDLRPAYAMHRAKPLTLTKAAYDPDAHSWSTESRADSSTFDDSGSFVEKETESFFSKDVNVLSSRQKKIPVDGSVGFDGPSPKSTSSEKHHTHQHTAVPGEDIEDEHDDIDIDFEAIRTAMSAQSNASSTVLEEDETDSAESRLGITPFLVQKSESESLRLSMTSSSKDERIDIALKSSKTTSEYINTDMVSRVQSKGIQHDDRKKVFHAGPSGEFGPNERRDQPHSSTRNELSTRPPSGGSLLASLRSRGGILDAVSSEDSESVYHVTTRESPNREQMSGAIQKENSTQPIAAVFPKTRNAVGHPPTSKPTSSTSGLKPYPLHNLFRKQQSPGPIESTSQRSQKTPSSRPVTHSVTPSPPLRARLSVSPNASGDFEDAATQQRVVSPSGRTREIVSVFESKQKSRTAIFPPSQTWQYTS